MSYNDKLNAYIKGELNEKDAEEVERDIDEFVAMLDFVDKKTVPAPLTDEGNINIAESLNKALNKKINKTIFRTVSTVILFAFLFFFGVYESDSMLTSYIIKGVYSIVYIVTVISMLYTSFVKKKRMPAIALIVWNVVLVALTFIVSGIMGDAYAFILPVYNGYWGIITCVMSVFHISSDNMIAVVLLIVATFILAVLALIFTKQKNIRFKEIPTVLLKIGITVFCIAGLVFVGTGTVNEINAGLFSDSSICAEAIGEAMNEDGYELITGDYIGKSIDEVKKMLGNEYEAKITYSDNFEMSRKNSYISFSFDTDDYGNVTAYYYHSPYRVFGSILDVDEIKEIANGSLDGKSQKTVLEGLYNVGLYPSSVNAYNDRIEVTVFVDKKGDKYNLGYFDIIEFVFEKGVLTKSGSAYDGKGFDGDRIDYFAE